jgi:hypothetical protein
VGQLQEMQNIEQTSDAGHSMYKTFKDTFNAFDRDGSAEMQYLVTNSSVCPDYAHSGHSQFSILGLRGMGEGGMFGFYKRYTVQSLKICFSKILNFYSNFT